MDEWWRAVENKTGKQDHSLRTRQDLISGWIEVLDSCSLLLLNVNENSRIQFYVKLKVRGLEWDKEQNEMKKRNWKKENQFFLFHSRKQQSYEETFDYSHSFFNFQTLHHCVRDCLLPWSEIQILIFSSDAKVLEKFSFSSMAL